VVQLDDLGGLEERRRHLREAHQQHGPDGEVGCDQAAAGAERGTQPVEVVVGEPGGAHDRVDAVLGHPGQVLPRRLHVGEVDHHLRAGVGERLRARGEPEVGVHLGDLAQVEPGVVGIDGSHELELGVVGHRLADRGAHPSRRTEHPDPDHRPEP
jgi:hypothetical protein